MRSVRSVAILTLFLGALSWAGSIGAEEDAAGFVRIAPDEIPWKPLPGYGGVRAAVLVGDPTKPGLYMVRVNFPPGVMTRPHFHPEDRYAVVLKGTWWTGTGDEFDPNSTVPLKAGSFMKQPAGAHHYDGAKDEEVIIQLTGYGPSGTNWIHPEDGHTGSSVKQ